MDRGAWQTGGGRARHDLVAKPPPEFQSIMASDSNIQLKIFFLLLKSTTQLLGLIQDPS